MNDEEKIKRCLVSICNSVAKRFIQSLEYDFHYQAQVLSVNEDGTCAISSVKDGTIKKYVRKMSHLTINGGEIVMVRETKNVPYSEVIDEVVII